MTHQNMDSYAGGVCTLWGHVNQNMQRKTCSQNRWHISEATDILKTRKK